MEGLFAILFVCFGLPVAVVFIRSYYNFREKQLAAARRDPQLLAASDEEKRELEARVRNLESIVCSVDFELNQRLNRIAAEASQAMKLPGAQRPDSPQLPGPRPSDPAGAAYGLGQLVPGQVVLGRYTVERELGRGGMGAVYLALDQKLGERVALKTISSVIAGDPAALVTGFRREVQAARRITHENVIRIHDLHEDGPLLFLSMEYVNGETLFSRVKRQGPLSVAEAVEVMGEVASGVAAAHAAGVIHRDLKPHNILLGSGPAVKVIDFGLARAGSTTGMSATGIILGTPEYMAPEQVRGQQIDARTDVYSLGAMAYFTLSGRPPFSGDSPIAVAFAQVHEAPRSLREGRPEVPAALEKAILRALDKDPAARFPDAAAWRTALEMTG